MNVFSVNKFLSVFLLGFLLGILVGMLLGAFIASAAESPIAINRLAENKLLFTWENISGDFVCLELVKPASYFVGCTNNDNHLLYEEVDANVIPHTGDSYRLYFTDVTYTKVYSEYIIQIPPLLKYTYLPMVLR